MFLISIVSVSACVTFHKLTFSRFSAFNFSVFGKIQNNHISLQSFANVTKISGIYSPGLNFTIYRQERDSLLLGRVYRELIVTALLAHVSPPTLGHQLSPGRRRSTRTQREEPGRVNVKLLVPPI